MSWITSRDRPFLALIAVGMATFLASGAYFLAQNRRQTRRAATLQGLYLSLQGSVYESESSLLHFLSTGEEKYLKQHRISNSRTGEIISKIRETDESLGLSASMLTVSAEELGKNIAAWNDAYSIPATEAKLHKAGSRLGGLTRKGTGPRLFGRVKESLDQVGLHMEQTSALYRSRGAGRQRAGLAGIGVGLALFLASSGIILVRQARRQRRIRREMQKSGEFYLFAEKLHHAYSPAQAARTLAQALGGIGGEAAVFLLERDHETLTIDVGSEGLRETRANSPLSADPSPCPALQTGKSLNASLRRLPCNCPLDIPAGGRICCVPLLVQGRVTGLARTILPEAASGLQAEIETLVRISSLALDSLLALDSARHEAVTDRLTGLFNRRFFEGFLEKQLQGAARDGSPVSLLMFDLDRFKSINDRHGHQAGDSVLESFARVLGENTREGDVASRFGGEEFAVILPATAPEAAREIGERIRTGAEQTPAPGPDTPVTVSIGLASFPENGKRTEDLVAAADSALYLAKQSGRNRLVSAQ